jgi:hypothetical protein
LAYQGTLIDQGNVNFNGQISITFRLYNQTLRGTVIWEETIPTVFVEEGKFQVNLG